MRHRRRPLKRLLWNKDQPPALVALAIVLGLIALVLAVLAVTSPASENPPPGTTTISWEVAIGFWIAAATVIAISVVLTARRQAIIIPRYQKDAPPFWERNRDEIAINATFTVIGGVLGIVGTLLIQALGDR
jgi:type VI protein secretion system component VasK